MGFLNLAVVATTQNIDQNAYLADCNLMIY